MCALVGVAIPMQLLNISRFSPAVRFSVCALLAAFMVIPVKGLVVAGYVWGLIGDPSIATIALMSLVCIKQLTGREVCDDRNVGALLLLVLAGGAMLYPLALGLSPYDPYALGFGSWMLYSALLAVALAAWWLQLPLVVAWIVASALAYTFGMFESTNLWNYLLDPIAVLIAIGWTAVKLIQSLGRAAFKRERAIA